MKKLLTTALIASTLFTGVAMADGRRGGKNGHFGKGKPNPMKVFRKLDLTDEQKTQIKAIFKDVKPAEADREAKRAERKAQMEKRRAIIESAIFDINAVNQMADEKSQQMRERFIKRIEAEHKAWQVLTSAQQEQAKKMMQKRTERMEKRKEKRQEKIKNKGDN